MTLNEVIANLGPPDRMQTPSPKKFLPSGMEITVRYLYYYLYRIGYSPSPEDIFVVFQFDYPDYPSRRKTALKALYTDDEALYIRNVPEESLVFENIPLLQTVSHNAYVLRQEMFYPLSEKPGFVELYCLTNPEVRLFLLR